ncbi:hypothetical protein LJB96_00690 [Methanobrevibacter sp. OttesenSCG-928-K11]|nr:hypothetical protein [Methanobrevibacter sp. OttesenSCG-928-K11]
MIISTFVICIVIFLISIAGTYLTDYFTTSYDYLDILFLLDGVILIYMSFIFLENYKKDIKLSNTPLVIINLFLIISIFLINTQIGTLNYFNIFCSVLLLFIIIIFIFIISKLLIYAERPFPVLIGEYTILEALLLLLFALTFESVKNVDYTMFSSFLILTPTYQLIYVLIVLGGLLLLGLYLNDKKMKKKFN